MRNLILFDDDARDHLLPLTFTRPVCELRVGILTIREKWERALDATSSWITQEYLTEAYPINIANDNLIVSGGIIPSPQLARLVLGLNPDEALMSGNELVAARIPGYQFDALIDGTFGEEIAGFSMQETSVCRIKRLWHILEFGGQEIQYDYHILTKNRRSQPISKSNLIIAPGDIFLEEGATVEGCSLNASRGPIYIGRDAVVMEGSLLRGPMVVGDHAIIKMGTRIYGPCAFGPGSKIGGELKNVFIQGNSNKSHDGFLGDSILGEWCNLGADTNSSNMKNNYSEIRMWNYALNRFEPTGRQFCGLVMGDHSKCGINTMFNTGTVVGVSANIFGDGYPRNFIPSFTWGGAAGFRTYDLSKALDTIDKVYVRREQTLGDDERTILSTIFNMTRKQRPWDE